MTRALGIAVEDGGDGSWAVRAERSHERRGAVYSHEIAALAWALDARRWVTLSAVTTAINNAGYSRAGIALTDDTLARSLIASARASSRPGAREDLFGMSLVRALGRARHDDLAVMDPSEVTRFDPLQAFLIVADFTLPVLWSQPIESEPDGRSRLPLSSGGLVTYAAARGSLCEDLNGLLKEGAHHLGGAVRVWATANLMLGGATTAATVGARLAKLANAVGYLEDAAHSIITSLTVDITYELPPMPIRLGSGPARFGIKVEMLYKFSDLVVDCGFLTGLTLPKKGDVPDVKVVWLVGKLSTYGSTSPNTHGGVWATGKTNDAGRAFLIFTPKPDPSTDGAVAIVDGTLPATAGVNVTLQGWSSLITSGVVDASRTQIIPWQITYHTLWTLSWDLQLGSTFTEPPDTGSTGGGSALYRLVGHTGLAPGASGEVAFQFASYVRHISGVTASSDAGDDGCGEGLPPDSTSTCTWDESLQSTSPGRFTFSSVDKDSDGLPVSVDLDIGPWPTETDVLTCSGTCGTYDPIDPFGGVATRIIDRLLDVDDTGGQVGHFTITGFTLEATTGDYVLVQPLSSSDQSESMTALMTWRLHRTEVAP